MLCACNKEELSVDKWLPPVDIKPVPPRWPVPPSPKLPAPPPSESSVCVYGFGDAVMAWGASEMPVTSFVLEDGTTIPVNYPLVKVAYSVYEDVEPGRPFHSVLSIQRQEGGASVLIQQMFGHSVVASW
jgi:hypothetical protein